MNNSYERLFLILKFIDKSLVRCHSLINCKLFLCHSSIYIVNDLGTAVTVD